MVELEDRVCSAFFTASSANELNPEHIFFVFPVYLNLFRSWRERRPAD